MKNENNKVSEKNIEELYMSQFYQKETLQNGDRHSNLTMYGLQPSPTKSQEKMAFHFKKLKRKYFQTFGGYYTNEDFLTEYSYAFIVAARELKCLEPMEILENEPELYNARLSFIRTGINRVFVEIATVENGDMKVSTRQGNKYIEAEIELLGSPMDETDEEGSTKLDYITEANNLYSNTKTELNHFTQYFIDNYENILTESQAKTFAEMMECYTPLSSRTLECIEERKAMFEQLNMTSSHIDRTMKSIKKRAVKAYENEFGGNVSQLSEQSKKFHKVLNNYIDTANDSNWSDPKSRQMALTDIVRANYDTEDFELIILKGLSLDEKKNITRAYNEKELLTNTVIRKIRQNIEAYTKEFAPIDITPSELTDYNYKENMFEDIPTMNGVRGRINMQGNIIVKDDDSGEWTNLND